MKISVIGAGYVGLVTAAGLAHFGHTVICIDTDTSKVELINRGISPILEKGLDDIMSKHIGTNGNLTASTEHRQVLTTDVSLICVGTPSNEDGSINLSHIVNVVKRLGYLMRTKNGYHLIVTRSTIIPGTTKNVIIPLLEEYSGKKVGNDLGVAFNPEFLQEGAALSAYLNPDRIIIGAVDEQAGDITQMLYRDSSAPVVRTDTTTAEMIKYASNAFLATKISYINEIANICKKLGIDVYDVAKGISFDYRIGDRFLNAGIGFGGSCLPKDLRALISASSTKLDYNAPLLRAVLDVNDTQALKIIEIAEQKLGILQGKKVAVLGLAFKPNTDDVRDAPAIRIITKLIEKGALVMTYDPKAIENAKAILPSGVEYCNSAREAISNSECILIVTEWDEFRDENLFKGKTVIDGRRVLNPRKAEMLCDYHGVCW